ncbi:exopolysaccharide production repressor protein [Mesorhizobium sp. M0488]|uniref:exopolysaccharide production repressor protein n=1 Tax=unclassified Mesorhizobium TaxID=325217 RepID=UPI00333A9AF0
MPAAALAAGPAPASARRTARPMLRPTRSQPDLRRQNQENGLPFRFFCCLLGMVLCSTALTVYFVFRSIGTVVVTTLACWLLLQLAYFASVLFLIWRSGCVSRAGQRAEHFDSCKEVGSEPPDLDEVTNESADLLQRDQMLAISLLLP